MIEMCRVRAKIKRSEVVLNTIGYRGSKEAQTPLADIRQARAFIMRKEDARRLGIRTGSKVTVKIGRARIPTEAKNWSRGSKLLLPKEQYPLRDIKSVRNYVVEVPSSRSRTRSRKRGRR